MKPLTSTIICVGVLVILGLAWPANTVQAQTAE
jgi:hypothetical protein